MNHERTKRVKRIEWVSLVGARILVFSYSSRLARFAHSPENPAPLPPTRIFKFSIGGIIKLTWSRVFKVWKQSVVVGDTVAIIVVVWASSTKQSLSTLVSKFAR